MYENENPKANPLGFAAFHRIAEVLLANYNIKRLESEDATEMPNVLYYF